MPEATAGAPNPSTVDLGDQGGKTLPEQDTYSVEDAMEEGAALAMEEVQDRLDDAGLEMDAETGEIIGGEAAFDPRARRRTRTRTTKGRRKGTRRRGRIAMARHPALVYDPRSRFGRARSVARRAKDPLSKMLDKIAPFVPMAAAAGTVYLKYRTRAPLIGATGPGDAFMKDIKALDVQAGIKRIIDNAGAIITPAIVGYVVKMAPVGPAKIRKTMGNGLMGVSGGELINHFFDPPVTGTPQNQGGFPMTAPQSWGNVGAGAMLSGAPSIGGR